MTRPNLTHQDIQTQIEQILFTGSPVLHSAAASQKIQDLTDWVYDCLEGRIGIEYDPEDDYYFQGADL